MPMNAQGISGPVRVRFAPNCEGHFAGFFTRTILYSWLFARRYGGQFIVRIDDTDTDRQVPGALSSFLEGMKWLGLHWDEGPEIGGPYGPYLQSQRLPMYREYLDRLLRTGKAYFCYCSQTRLAALAEEQRNRGEAPRYDGHCRRLSPAERQALRNSGVQPTVRLAVPTDGEVRCHDLLRGDFTTPATDVGDFIIARPDGWPTYHLAVVVDDHLMRITHVIRGTDGLPNMSRQALVQGALGLPALPYLHFPLARTETFSPSERFYRRGAYLFTDELQKAGFLADAVVNYYALLGYSYPGTREIMSRQELVALFDYRRISKALVVQQSIDKLLWVNRRYIQHETPVAALAEAALPFLAEVGLAKPRDADAVGRLVDLLPHVRTRMRLLADVVPLTGFVFRYVAPTPAQLEQVLPSDQGRTVLEYAETHLAVPTVGSVGAAKRLLVVALAGEHSPLPPEVILQMLGTPEARSRIRAARTALAT